MEQLQLAICERKDLISNNPYANQISESSMEQLHQELGVKICLKFILVLLSFFIIPLIFTVPMLSKTNSEIELIKGEAAYRKIK